jgi:hypothetical protein
MTINNELKMKGKEVIMTEFKAIYHYLPGGTKKNLAKYQSG